MADIIDAGGRHRCAYEQCECYVSALETYCSDYCSDADDAAEVEMECDCKHAPCSLSTTVPLYTTPEEQE